MMTYASNAIELSIPSNFTLKEEEVELNSVPDDLHIDLPKSITLDDLGDNKFGHNDTVKVSCDSDKRYRVDITLKDTAVTYTGVDDYTASGVASIADSAKYSWSYEEITSGTEIPLSVVVDNPKQAGNYSTVLNFSINVYEL